jgi:hypothetical protein
MLSKILGMACELDECGKRKKHKTLLILPTLYACCHTHQEGNAFLKLML